MASSQREYQLLFNLQASLGTSFTKNMSAASKATTDLQNTIKNLNSTSKDISSYTRQEAALEKSTASLAKLQKEYDSIQKEMDETGDSSGKLQKALEGKATQIDKVNAKVLEQQQKLDNLGTSLRNAGVDTNNLSAENEKYAQSIEKAKQAQEDLNKLQQAQSQNSAAISETKSQLGTAVAGTTAAAAVTWATTIEPTLNFNNDMSMVSTMMDGTTAEIQAKVNQYSTESIKLSSSLGMDTQDITGGLYDVISAYGDTEDAMKQLQVTAEVAKAGGSSVSDALGLLSATTKGYGDTSAEAQQKAADLAFQTVKLGQTTFPELASAMGSVIPTAAAMGLSQEELFGSMATLTGVTGTASEVSTQLKGVLQGFLSPSKDMTAQMEALGYASGDAMIEALGLQGSLETLKTAVDGDTLALGNLFGSSEAQTAIFAMVGEQAENLTQKTLAMSEATGAATDAFNIMNNTDMAKWEQAKQTFQNLGIVIGQSLLPAITPLIQKTSDLVTAFSAWASENPEVVQTIASVVAALALMKIGFLAAKLIFLEVKGAVIGVKTAFKVAEIAMSGMTGSVKGFSSILSVVQNPIFLVIAGLALLAAAIWYVSTHLEQVRGFIEKAFGAEALAVFDGMIEKVQAVGQIITMLCTGDLEGARSAMQSVFGDSALAIFDNFVLLTQNAMNLFVAGLEFAKPFIQLFGDFLGSTMTTAFELIFTLIDSFLTILNGLITFITGVFTGNWQQAWEGIKTIFSGVWNGIKAICSGVINTIVSGVNTVIRGLNALSIPDWVSTSLSFLSLQKEPILHLIHL